MNRDLEWLVAANVLFVAGGLVAYATRISLALVTAFALVAAMAGLWRIKQREGPLQTGADLGASFAAGGWAVVAVLILLPYITVGEGNGLWASKAFAGLTVAAASLTMLGWNASILASVPEARRNVRSFAGFHGLLIVVAFSLALRGDGDAVTFMLDGIERTAIDLRLAPALAAAPGLSWALGLWSQRA